MNFPKQKNTTAKPILSLIIASRNDQFMGNSTWRLETTLNFTAKNICRLGRENDVEIIVADWGSETPLRDTLNLCCEATQIVSFLSIPQELAQELQGDSPFPEVLALNAAARRSHGEFIGRIDNDTLVGLNFLKRFFNLIDGNDQSDFSLRHSLVFSNRRRVPYWFSVQCPPLWEVICYIQDYGKRLLIQSGSTLGKPFYYGPVGIWLLHRTLWMACSGYDERLLYWGWMEPEMIHRLMQKYQLVDWDQIYGCDFYHLEHYNPRRRRKTNRKANADISNNSLRPNPDSWGLDLYHLQLTPYAIRDADLIKANFVPQENSQLAYRATLIKTKVPQLIDTPFVLFYRFLVALETLQNQPIKRWPDICKRWFHILMNHTQ